MGVSLCARADLSQAQQASQTANRMASSTHVSVGNVSYSNGDNSSTKAAEHTANTFGAARATANLRSAEQQAAHTAAAASKATRAQLQNYGVKGNPNLAAQTSSAVFRHVSALSAQQRQRRQLTPAQR